MRLEPLYRFRFSYPESWAISLDGGWQQMFFIAEGRCEGKVNRAVPRRELPSEARRGWSIPAGLPGGNRGRDGAVIMVELHGYGRAYPPERRQVVGSVFHSADRPPIGG